MDTEVTQAGAAAVVTTRTNRTTRTDHTTATAHTMATAVVAAGTAR
jgi:hypothetical protein